MDAETHKKTKIHYILSVNLQEKRQSVDLIIILPERAPIIKKK